MRFEDGHFAYIMDILMHDGRFPLEEISSGNIYKGPGEQTPCTMPTKRRRVCRQRAPISDIPNSPHLSRLSSPDNRNRSQLVIEQENDIECHTCQERPRICATQSAGRSRENPRKDLLLRAKLKVLPHTSRERSQR